MKYLTKSADLAHLHGLRELLETNGIPAVVKGENTARMLTPFAMTEPSLWVYLDEQAAEAERLILDPSHEVQHRVDVAEFYRVTEEVANNPGQLYESLLLWGLAIAAISIAIIVLVALSGL